MFHFSYHFKNFEWLFIPGDFNPFYLKCFLTLPTPSEFLTNTFFRVIYIWLMPNWIQFPELQSIHHRQDLNIKFWKIFSHVFVTFHSAYSSLETNVRCQHFPYLRQKNNIKFMCVLTKKTQTKSIKNWLCYFCKIASIFFSFTLNKVRDYYFISTCVLNFAKMLFHSCQERKRKNMRIFWTCTSNQWVLLPKIERHMAWWKKCLTFTYPQRSRKRKREEMRNDEEISPSKYRLSLYSRFIFHSIFINAVAACYTS